MKTHQYITHFQHQGREYPITFTESTDVKEGVICDVHTIGSDNSRDLGIITIQPGYRSPRQRVLKGTKTVQRFISGEAYLYVTDIEGNDHAQFFKSDNATQNNDVEVRIGEIMQWSSMGPDPLICYEICEPPYEDGRFENLPD